MTRLYEDDAELYDIAFDWDISDEADWLVERLQATTVLEPGCGTGNRADIDVVRCGSDRCVARAGCDVGLVHHT